MSGSADRAKPSRLYFDHNASTPAEPAALERFAAVERDCPANPGSVHRAGRAAREVLESAREEVAALLGFAADQVVFTSGGTEANNLALRGMGDPSLRVLTSALEHPSVFEPATLRGCATVPVDDRGRAQWGMLATDPPRGEAIGLVATAHGQNEVGTVQDIAAAAAVARALGVPLHVDAAQTVGRLELDEMLRLAASVTLSGHKFGALRGCGVLAGPGVPRVVAQVVGGGQEFGLRSGTPSVALAAAFATGLRLAVSDREQRAMRMAQARAAFEATLVAALDVTLLTPQPSEGGLPNTTMVAFSGVEGRTLLPALDIAGVEASAGSACSAGSPRPPRVLAEMGLDEVTARRCVRFSFGHRTEISDANEGAQRVVATVRRMCERA